MAKSAPKREINAVPIAYCAVQHAGGLFPGCLPLLAADATAPGQYAFFSVWRTQCCAGCAATEIACNPDTCGSRMTAALGDALATDHPVASFAAAAARQYRAYYDGEILGMRGHRRPKAEGVIASLLDDLFGDG